jgi:acetyl esterase
MFKKMRQKLGGTLIDITLNSATRIAKVMPKAKPILSDLEIDRDIAYQEGSKAARHRLDVYRSKRFDGPRPVFIYIHGGGFRILSKDTHWMMNGILAHQGFCVFSINYGLAPQHAYPEGVHDVFAAIQWIARHAERFGGDISEIVVGGESAGANLTLGVALAHCVEGLSPESQAIFDLDLSIKALAPACGLLEVSNTHRFNELQPDMPQLYRDRIAAICGLYIDSSRDTEPLASPLLWFESDEKPSRPIPPMFVGVGDKDPVFSDSTRMIDALTHRGIACEGGIYTDAIHAFQAFFWQDNARKFWQEQRIFLSQYVSGLRKADCW